MTPGQALVSFVLGWSIFSLAYGAGYGLLLLGSLAMHGAQPWSYLAQGAVGALLGGSVGLWRSGRSWTARIVWIAWSAAGVLVSLGLDHENLSRRQAAAPLLPPALMLGASVGGLLLLRRALGPERTSPH
jgi:hypothetical protein